MALEALSQQQQAARLGQWGEAAGPFLQGSVAFPLPQQLAHLAQPGMARFPPQLLRAASWGLSANMEDEAITSASTGPPFTRLDWAPVCSICLLLVVVPQILLLPNSSVSLLLTNMQSRCK